MKSENIKNSKAAVVLLSGGQDSTTCLYWAKQRFDTVLAIGFDYNQRHKLELEQAKLIAKEANVELCLMELPILSDITKNALVNCNISVETYNENQFQKSPPNTEVVGRNMLFLTYAAIYAKQYSIENIVTGVSQTDFSGYPDCREAFILSLEKTLTLSMDYPYKIHTPLMHINKAQAWELADKLGILNIIKNKTLTCYNGIIGDGCTACPACALRKRGYEEFIKRKI
ncbi:MAG: 7-cyano-7-deazaguanine synthase QueC [Firmicutes bacterium]|nr:7-cyano-7-deazaguanine synthase QueC [Bacillota bacterium]